MNEPTNPTDLYDEQQVRDFFARIEKEYPQLIEAIKAMNISYQQYLTSLQALNRHSSFSTGSTWPAM
jgi:cell division septum initiation protein DivIVA